MRFEVIFHHAECVVAPLHLLRKNCAILLNETGKMPEPNDGNVGLVTILLEKHPLKDLCTLPGVLWNKRCAFRKMPQNSVGFGQTTSVRPFDKRHPVICVLGDELARSSLALKDVKVNSLKGYTELRQQKPYFVAVARFPVIIEAKHSTQSLPSVRC